MPTLNMSKNQGTGAQLPQPSARQGWWKQNAETETCPSSWNAPVLVPQEVHPAASQASSLVTGAEKTPAQGQQVNQHVPVSPHI
jgi:hypothetical protein